jgi:ankyrin repeat protein
VEIIADVPPGRINDAGADGNTRLIIAASAGHLACTRDIVAKGADIDLGPILFALERQNSKIVSVTKRDPRRNPMEAETAQMLMEHMVAYGTHNKVHTTALDGAIDLVLGFAAKYGSYKFVKLALENGAHVNFQMFDGDPLGGGTPLMAAVDNGYTELAELLLKHGADPSRADNAGYNPIMAAAQRCNGAPRYAELLQLLISFGADVNSMSQVGHSALYLAVAADTVECTEILVSSRAFLGPPAPGKALLGTPWGTRTSKYFSSLLKIAIRHGSFRVAKMALEKGADVNYQDEDGSTLLLLAAARNSRTFASAGNNRVLQLLCENGADGPQCQAATHVELEHPAVGRVTWDIGTVAHTTRMFNSLTDKRMLVFWVALFAWVLLLLKLDTSLEIKKGRVTLKRHPAFTSLPDLLFSFLERLVGLLHQAERGGLWGMRSSLFSLLACSSAAAAAASLLACSSAATSPPVCSYAAASLLTCALYSLYEAAEQAKHPGQHSFLGGLLWFEVRGSGRQEAAQRTKREAAHRTKREAAQRTQHEAAQRKTHEAAQRTKHEAAQRTKHEAAEQAKHEAAEQAKHEAAQQAKHEAAQRTKREAAQRTQHEAAQRTKREAAQRTQHEAAQRTQHEAAEQAKHEAAQRTKHEAAQQARQQAKRSVPEPEQEQPAPDEYYCPITTELMHNPVLASDGHTYEREAIEAWSAKGGATVLSPMTNEPLLDRVLTPNRSMRVLILDWQSARYQQESGASNMPISEWLVSVSRHLACYAAAFKEHGYDDTALLVEATEEDMEEAFEELHMKKGHRRVLMNALATLQSRGVGE